MTVADITLAPGWRMRPSKFSVVGAVGKRMVPYLIEATLIPSLVFYGLLMLTSELRWAIVGALAWSYAAVGRRVVGGRAVPGLLILATLGISVRTLIYLLSNNSFIYFVQPIMRTVATATLFAVSVLIGRPLIARFACNFCPLSPDVRSRPAIVALFKRLPYLWAAVNALAASTSLTLLLTLPGAAFVGIATVAAWVITFTGVVLTVRDAVRTAHGEQIGHRRRPQRHAVCVRARMPAVRAPGRHITPRSSHHKEAPCLTGHRRSRARRRWARP